MSKLTISVFIFMKIVEIISIWPPAYKVNLTQSETFVISEELSDDDTDDVYEAEDEMIQKEQLEAINFKQDTNKYFGLHQLAMRKNKKPIKYSNNEAKKNVIKESNFDKDESQPWIAGYVDKNGNYIKPENDNVFYMNEMAKSSFAQKNEIKREVLKVINVTVKKDQNYDYVNMKHDYENDIKIAEKSNNTLNFTDVKEDETIKDAIKTMVDFKTPKNCTQEESKGIGIVAAKCLLQDIKKPHLKSRNGKLFEQILRIFIIWCCIYILIAIPCWCQRGHNNELATKFATIFCFCWCCCCFQCRVCKPHERIDEAKKFLVDNPPGIYHMNDGKKITYNPTIYEKYMQKRLEEAIMKL